MVVPAKKEIPAIRLLMAAAAMVCCFGGKEVSGNVERNRWWKWRERSRAISVMAGTSAAASLEPRERDSVEGRREFQKEGGRGVSRTTENRRENGSWSTRCTATKVAPGWRELGRSGWRGRESWVWVTAGIPAPG